MAIVAVGAVRAERAERAERRIRLAVTTRGYPAGIVVIAATLILLISVVIAGSLLTDRSVIRTQRAVVLNTAYQHAASGVAAEESVERKYRLQPGPVPLRDHTAAEVEVAGALGKIFRLGNAQDRRLVTRVTAEHDRYVRAVVAMFSAVDRHESAATVNVIDSREVDPVFGAMQIEIYDAAARHETSALREAVSAHTTGRIIIGLDVATLLVGLGAIVAGALTLARSQRRLRAQRDTNHHLAFHDGLTGLANRAAFRARSAEALISAQQSGEPVAVLFLDLDRFKDVNDTLGHHYGDLLLSQVAQRFAAMLRPGDSVARIGGDEFAILLRSANRDDAVTVAVQLTDTLSEPFSVRDISLDVEASIGIALAQPHEDVEVVLRHADVAMYEAKAEHIPYAVYELQRDDHTMARLALLGELRRGMNRGELTLHYQPKVDARTGKLHSAEALARWNHPTRGLLGPDCFVPVAESTALIHQLTDEVLRQALAQARIWLDQGRVIPVAVNVSARSLHDAEFPAKIQRHLQAAGVPSTVLHLELTESAMMVDPGQALAVLEALADMGISLSIDDFGTGYSSMSYLKRLRVHELKIDRSFVTTLVHDPDDVVMVQSTIDLGHNLGLRVVAEGVEDAETQTLLAAMGCDEVQGYHISRPVPASLFQRWLDQADEGQAVDA